MDDINGNTNLVLSGPDGTPVCGSECGLLPSDESVTLMGTIEVVPQTNGPAGPIAALQIQPAGEVQVMVRAPSSSPQSGERELVARTVTLVASQDGIAVVEGLEVGEEVQLFATGSPAGLGNGGDSTGPAPEENNSEGSGLGETEEQQSNHEGTGTSEGDQ